MATRAKSKDEWRAEAAVTARALATEVKTDVSPPPIGLGLGRLVFYSKDGAEPVRKEDWPARALVPDYNLHNPDGTMWRCESGHLHLKCANGEAEYDIVDYYPARGERKTGWCVCVLIRSTYDG